MDKHTKLRKDIIPLLLKDDESLCVFAIKEQTLSRFNIYIDWASKNLNLIPRLGDINGLLALVNLDDNPYKSQRQLIRDCIEKILASLKINQPEGEVAAELFALGVIRTLAKGAREIGDYEPGFFFDTAKKYPTNRVLSWFHNLEIWIEWQYDTNVNNPYGFPRDIHKCFDMFYEQCELIAPISNVQIVEVDDWCSLAVDWGHIKFPTK